MADLLIELVSEEIPARMQADAGRNLARLVETALKRPWCLERGQHNNRPLRIAASYCLCH